MLSGMKVLAASATVVLLGIGCAATNVVVKNNNIPAANNNTSAPAVADTSDAAIRNAGYQFGGDFGLNEVKLIDGYFESGTYPYDGFVRMDSSIGRGDVNGDGVADAVVVLRVNQGGTGTWPVVFVVLDENGKAVSYKSGGFEDRAVINSIDIKDAVVAFDLTVHGPGDPMCCPTLSKTEIYRWYDNRFELLRAPDPAAVKANTDFSKYLPITTKIENFNGMNHAADETDVYRNGVLMFTIEPGFPIGGAEGNTEYGYDWEVWLTPVPNGDIKAALNVRPTKIMMRSTQAPTFIPVEESNKSHPEGILLRASDASTIYYDIAARRFVHEASR